MKPWILVLAVLIASGCQLKNPTPSQQAEDALSRRGEVVSRGEGLAPAPQPGTIEVVEEPMRELEGAPGGRVWLLGLYHETLARKSELERRLAEREASLADSVRERAVLRADFERTAARLTQQDARVDELEAQALELARRLADSEIARLEAEKAALEREAALERRQRP